MKLTPIPLLVLAVALQASCTAPEDRIEKNPSLAIKPKAAPVQNLTNFSEVLACVGRNVAERGSRTFFVGNDEVRNESGAPNVPSSGRTMLQSAFSILSKHSNGKIIWSGWRADSAERTVYWAEVAQKIKSNAKGNLPDFIIQGAVTQFEKEAQKASRDGDLKAGDYAKLGYSDSASLSAMAVSLTLHDLSDSSLPLYQGVQSDNIISIVTKDDSLGVMAGLVQIGGVGFNVSMVQKEGVSAALLNLMQLAAIEITGKFYEADFDYRLCLKPETRNTVAAAPVAKPSQPAPRVDVVKAAPAATISRRDGGTTFRVGEVISLVVSSSGSGYINCFYSMKDGAAVRVYPNKYRQDNRLTSGTSVAVPGDANIEITAEPANPPEAVDCLVSGDDASSYLPDALRGNALAPTRGLNIEAVRMAVERDRGVGSAAVIRMPILTRN